MEMNAEADKEADKESKTIIPLTETVNEGTTCRDEILDNREHAQSNREEFGVISCFGQLSVLVDYQILSRVTLKKE